MSIMVFAVVMFAALLHAGWNAIVKSATDKFLTTIMVTLAAAGLSAVLIPVLRTRTPTLPLCCFVHGRFRNISV